LFISGQHVGTGSRAQLTPAAADRPAPALTLSAQLIVADEPVSALDVSIRAQVLDLMKRLQGSRGLTYVVISRDVGLELRGVGRFRPRRGS
jgi:ABC-type microcin C transport system duplicated ATPase subunit YejF